MERDTHRRPDATRDAQARRTDASGHGGVVGDTRGADGLIRARDSIVRGAAHPRPRAARAEARADVPDVTAGRE
eukprot:993504-Pleurochrysis_carterae.AAC.1